MTIDSIIDSIMSPVDCVLSEWTTWTACSATCGDGTKTRSRNVTVDAQHGGMACEGGLEASEECQDKKCPVHCALGDWGGWSACSATCGSGTRSRSRSVTVQAQHGGQACEDSSQALEECKVRECPCKKVHGVKMWRDKRACEVYYWSGKHKFSHI